VAGRPTSGAIAFIVDMPDGQTVATTLGGREGVVGSLSVLGPSRSSVTAIARVAGTTSQISAAAALHDRIPDDMLPLTQEALAQLLGVRRTTVTPMMSKLRAAGGHQVRQARLRRDRPGAARQRGVRMLRADAAQDRSHVLPGIVRAATCRCAVPGKPHRPFQ
jgi:Crp-like helix-turn-helix domain